MIAVFEFPSWQVMKILGIPAENCFTRHIIFSIYICNRLSINLQLIMPLYNTIDARLLKEQLHSMDHQRVTISFYKYHQIEDVARFRNDLYRAWNDMGILGRTYVASEGINAQISVPRENFNSFRDHLFSIDFLKNIRLNLAVDDNGKSFFKLKITIRNKIVADGINDPAFDVTQSGSHVDASAFNQLADSPDTLIVDMRNHYESEVGHFRNAICPDVDTFREELQAVEDLMKGNEDKNLLLYCTGGIRCEKASAWMKYKGFKNVFQLDGGIINYTRQVKENGLLSLTNDSVKELRLISSVFAISAENHATTTPTVKMTPAIYCLFSVRNVGKSTMHAAHQRVQK
jgi:predicted sulfurtransferase